MHLSLACVLAESAKRHTDRIAVIDGETAISYGELWRQSRGHAAALRSLGVRPGDRVALMVPNVADFPRVYYAILALGAVVVPVHLLLNADDTAHVLRDSAVAVVVAAGESLDVARRAARIAEVPVVTVGPPGADREGAGPASLDAIAERLAPVPTHATRSADDPAVVIYTSGTTGRSKGAVLNQFNLVMNAMINSVDVLAAHPDDVVLGCLPLFHSFGQTVAMNATFRAGATLVLQRRFDAGQAIDLMKRHRATLFFGTPTMYVALLEAARTRTDLPWLRLCLSGGSALPVPILERFTATFATTVYEGYGLSETSPTVCVNQSAFGTRAGTVGHPIWGVEVDIARADVEDRIEPLPAGELGEVVVRGHNVFTGYLNQPDATRAAIVDGWLRTGDLGVKDGCGYLSIVDRKKDLIIRGGHNVYPREVEEAMLQHPAVAEVAVVGLPDPLRGEEICAVVVLDRDAGACDAEDILDWARQRLSRHTYPRRVEVVDALPLTASHKVLKGELRWRYAAPPHAGVS